MKNLQVIDIQSWDEPFSLEIQELAVQSLESGKVVYFPTLVFPLLEHEHRFLAPHKVDPKTKNVSYDRRTDNLKGTLFEDTEAQQLKEMIRRYALQSRAFIDRLIPHYQSTLIQAKTSLRPVEIAGRKSSYRKDDTLLHVDAFPSNPSKGQRILRIFTNINPTGQSRVWRVGEPFADVVHKMAPRVPRPLPGFSHFLKWLKITKDLRTPYDHYMLHMHNKMKGDADYQRQVNQEEIHFPPGSSWMVYTDQVSHAALAGQHVLEQTFHLPVHGLKNPETAPLKVLEKFVGRHLT